MKNHRWILVALCLAALPTTGRAIEQNRPCPIEMDASLATESVALGEPVVLTVTARNLADRYASLRLGSLLDEAAWLNLTLVDSRGRLATPVTDPASFHASVARSVACQHLGAMDRTEDAIVVTRVRRITAPGRYELRIAVNAPCAVGGDTPTEPLRFEKALTLHVRPAAPFVLRRTAQRLARAAANGREPRQADLAIQELMSMPEAYSLPLARELALTRVDLVSYGVSQELERMGSPAATDLLREIRRWRAGNEQVRFEHEMERAWQPEPLIPDPRRR